MKFGESARFSARDLIDMQGTRVYALRGGLTPEGTSGVVVHPKFMKGEWLLVVDWEDSHQEMFTKRDAENLLTQR